LGFSETSAKKRMALVKGGKIPIKKQKNLIFFGFSEDILLQKKGKALVVKGGKAPGTLGPHVHWMEERSTPEKKLAGEELE
jgi:hypothetical protein